MRPHGRPLGLVLAMLAIAGLSAGCATPPPRPAVAPEAPLAVDVATSEGSHAPYFAEVRRLIQGKWVYPREEGERGIEGMVVIEFHIAKDGRLTGVVLRRSSGFEILDEYAMNAIRLAEPFPPVPDGLASRVLAINGNFIYRVKPTASPTPAPR